MHLLQVSSIVHVDHEEDKTSTDTQTNIMCDETWILDQRLVHIPNNVTINEKKYKHLLNNKKKGTRGLR